MPVNATLCFVLSSKQMLFSVKKIIRWNRERSQHLPLAGYLSCYSLSKQQFLYQGVFYPLSTDASDGFTPMCLSMSDDTLEGTKASEFKQINGDT